MGNCLLKHSGNSKNLSKPQTADKHATRRKRKTEQSENEVKQDVRHSVQRNKAIGHSGDCTYAENRGNPTRKTSGTHSVEEQACYEHQSEGEGIETSQTAVNKLSEGDLDTFKDAFNVKAPPLDRHEELDSTESKEKQGHTTSSKADYGSEENESSIIKQRVKVKQECEFNTTPIVEGEHKNKSLSKVYVEREYVTSRIQDEQKNSDFSKVQDGHEPPSRVQDGFKDNVSPEDSASLKYSASSNVQDEQEVNNSLEIQAVNNGASINVQEGHKENVSFTAKKAQEEHKSSVTSDKTPSETQDSQIEAVNTGSHHQENQTSNALVVGAGDYPIVTCTDDKPHVQHPVGENNSMATTSESTAAADPGTNQDQQPTTVFESLEQKQVSSLDDLMQSAKGAEQQELCKDYVEEVKKELLDEGPDFVPPMVLPLPEEDLDSSTEDLYRGADEILKERKGKVTTLLPQITPWERSSVLTEVDILTYSQKEWKGNTRRSSLIRRGYEEVALSFSHLRQVRGDNYCALRATLYQLLNQRMDLPTCLQDDNITLLSEKLQAEEEMVSSWRFPSQYCSDGQTESPVEQLQQSLTLLKSRLQEASKADSPVRRQELCDLVFQGAEEEFQLLEALKVLMLLTARELHQLMLLGADVPVFCWLLFARDSSDCPHSFFINHLSHVGFTGGLEQVEMFLLGYTLQTTIEVYRLYKVGTEEFVTYYPDDHKEDWPQLCLLTEDDRHYNVPVGKLAKPNDQEHLVVS